ncbi:forkhead-associated protein [Mycobacterium arosiense]|uniref:Forkhead-associated protein n=1 Tax=Mycobacterium arosiense ATCC BAA-1401 = DSM 45069 TaxID=1265311 RepID=A0A1W9Z7X4_MYCAI|nr:forkhead-associated protein [Mycobacterium arosiense]ORA08853.1 forkhead-associated protein [Mycobacterium arosiense ATCC BAA-1401 = DSM 45069]
MAKESPDEGEAPIIVGMAEAAMHMYTTAIAALPDTNDDEFRPRVEVILSGLRKLRKSLTDAAARSRLTPGVIVALSEARRCYDDLMERAAAAPAAALGQQLYVARLHAKLSAKEAANGAGLRADLLDDLEAGETPTEDEATNVKGLIESLGRGGVPAMKLNENDHKRLPAESFDESVA